MLYYAYVEYPTRQHLTHTNRMHDTQKFFHGSPCSWQFIRGHTPPVTAEMTTDRWRDETLGAWMILKHVSHRIALQSLQSIDALATSQLLQMGGAGGSIKMSELAEDGELNTKPPDLS